MPLFIATESTESAQFATWLEGELTNFRSVVHGLSTEQLLAKPIPSSELTLAWLIRHIGSVAEEWTERGAAAPEKRDWDTLPVRQQWEEGMALDSVPENATAESLLAEYDQRVVTAVENVRNTDLDATVPKPEMPWIPPGTPDFSGRWVILHVLDEVSRHSGHADILREAIDGSEMYSLRAEHQGIDMSYIGEWFARHPEVPMPAW